MIRVLRNQRVQRWNRSISDESYSFGEFATKVVSAYVGDKLVDIAVKALLTQSSIKPPPYDHNTKNYDFIIDIENVCSIGNKGWQIQTADKRGALLTTTKFRNPAVKGHGRTAIVSFLGYYSKGKSFILNGIYNANQPGGVGPRVGEKPGVCTIGLSGVFSPPDSLEPTLLLLDTAGRNAPASRITLKDFNIYDMNSTKELQQAISVLRSKERLIDDMILQLSDSIIYVVDELLNEDQRTILHLIEKCAENGVNQTVYIAHNFMKYSEHDPRLESHIKEQIEETFHATKIDPELPIYRSHWQFAGNQFQGVKSIDVFHFVVCRNSDTDPTRGFIDNVVGQVFSPCEQNLAVFAWLHEQLPTKLRNNFIPGKSIIDYVIEAASKHVMDHVRVIDCAPKPQPTGIFEKVVPVQSCIFFDLPAGKCLENKIWEIRDHPSPFSEGEYKPNSCSYETQDGTTFVIRVDLPGLNHTHNWDENKGTPPSNGNWFRTNQWPPKGTENTFSVVVEGRRVPKREDDKSPNTYGAFSLKFDAPTKYKLKDSPVFSNSTLWIFLEREVKEKKGMGVKVDDS